MISRRILLTRKNTLFIPALLIQTHLYHNRFDMRRAKELQGNLKNSAKRRKHMVPSCRTIVNMELLIRATPRNSNPPNIFV